ncbi:unnamed protein product [Heterosigma akashiwo]
MMRQIPSLFFISLAICCSSFASGFLTPLSKKNHISSPARSAGGAKAHSQVYGRSVWEYGARANRVKQHLSYEEFSPAVQAVVTVATGAYALVNVYAVYRLFRKFVLKEDI